MTATQHAAQRFIDECICACHRPSSEICPIPSWLNPWLGKANIPRTLPASLVPSWFPCQCDNPYCLKNQQKTPTVRYYPPAWFAHVEASIRFEAFPVHFYIQTPRVVPSLSYLLNISFNEFQIKLSTRELTLHDIEPNGRSVLHVRLPFST